MKAPITENKIMEKYVVWLKNNETSKCISSWNLNCVIETVEWYLERGYQVESKNFKYNPELLN